MELGNLFNPVPPPAKPTNIQRFAAGVRLVSLLFMFFAVLFFVCARVISHFAYFASLRAPPTLPFLRNQYDFLLLRGIDPNVAASPLRIFQFLIWILVFVLFLRVVSSPFLFGLIDWRKTAREQGAPIAGLVAGWMLMAVAVWASTDITSLSASRALGIPLERSPAAYVCLEVFLFSTGSILFVEAPIVLCDFLVTWVRARKPLSASKSSQR